MTKTNRGPYLRREVRQAIWWTVMVGIATYGLSVVIPAYWAALPKAEAALKAWGWL